MWFKQIQVFQLNPSGAFNASELAFELEKLTFCPCLPNLFVSMGWVSPTEDFTDFTKHAAIMDEQENDDEDKIIQNDLSLVHEANGYLMICMQTEEKILPASVVSNQVKKRIKEIQINEKRKVTAKEKQALRETVYFELIPQAFSKISKTYAYIDTKNNRLILNALTEKKTESFISLLKKTLSNTDIKQLETKKISNIMTNWLQKNKYPKSLTIENSCVLQDPNKQGRIIRCQQQDLFAPSIQSLLEEGCAISQMQFTWNDQLTFTLKDDFTLQSLNYQDAVIELANETTTETKLERFNTDFLIMTGVLNQLLTELLNILEHSPKK